MGRPPVCRVGWAIGRQVSRNASSGARGGSDIARGITATSFTDYEVTRSVPYYYVVKAVDQSLNRSTNSSQVRAALPAVLPAGWGDANIGSPATSPMA